MTACTAVVIVPTEHCLKLGIPQVCHHKQVTKENSLALHWPGWSSVVGNSLRSSCRKRFFFFFSFPRIYEIPNATTSSRWLNGDVCLNCINKVIYYPEGLRWTLHAIAIITWTSLAGNIRNLPRQSVLQGFPERSWQTWEVSFVWIGTWVWKSLKPRAPPWWKRVGWEPEVAMARAEYWRLSESLCQKWLWLLPPHRSD